MCWLGSWRFTVKPPTITRPVRNALPHDPWEGSEWPIYSENRAPEVEIKLPDQSNGCPSTPRDGCGGRDANLHAARTFIFIRTFALLLPCRLTGCLGAALENSSLPLRQLPVELGQTMHALGCRDSLRDGRRDHFCFERVNELLMCYMRKSE